MSDVEKIQKMFYLGILNWQEAYNVLASFGISEKEIIESIGTLQEYRNAAEKNSEN